MSFSGYQIAPFNAVADSLVLGGSVIHPCSPVKVDSGQVVYVVGDTVFIYTPHVCAPANAFEVIVYMALSIIGGAFAMWAWMNYRGMLGE